MMQRSRRLMEIAQNKLPLVVILQAWILPPENMLPEIEELRVMAWQAMLSGAETLSFFEYNQEIWKKTPGFHNKFRNLMAELTAFSSRHRDDDVVSVMDEDGVLTSTLTSVSGRRYRIEVNTRRKAVRDLAAMEVRTTLLSTVSDVYACDECQITAPNCCASLDCCNRQRCFSVTKFRVDTPACPGTHRQLRRLQRRCRRLCR